MEDVTKSKCYNRLKLAIKVSFVTNLVLVVALPCVYIAHRINDSNRHLPDKTQTAHQQSAADTLPDRICLTCSYFNDVIGVEKNVLYEFVSGSNGHRLCCINDGFGIQNIFFEMLMGNQYDSHQHSTRELKEMTQRMQWWRERDYSAHLYGDFYDIKNGALSWTIGNSFGTGFIRNLTLLPGSSKVRLTSFDGGSGEGMYFIYSLITLTLNTSTNTSLGIHTINKCNDEIMDCAPITLARRKFGGDRESNEAFGNIMSFLCITERLTIGDTLDISIHVSPKSSYNRNGIFSNYFGIFKL
ncbi:uncharacterized protein LOC110467385 [Mizuhopecten yessoensis]|uniref:TNF family profile domain-containing protein n=1 Tax=Mizuhopecten yessoensis TaxID=6573 RepID=A0A210R1E6_MIZYE|nr:uncharacterized protein LOC110467385 [Mizuhopecten yessoensis]OWF54838.1 hypothetical protein KP79_PYT20824 [Mizuhopecten yessoensis]